MSDPHAGNTGKYFMCKMQLTPTVLEEFKSHQLWNFGIIKIQYIWQNTILMCMYADCLLQLCETFMAVGDVCVFCIMIMVVNVKLKMKCVFI